MYRVPRPLRAGKCLNAAAHAKLAQHPTPAPCGSCSVGGRAGGRNRKNVHRETYMPDTLAGEYAESLMVYRIAAPEDLVEIPRERSFFLPRLVCQRLSGEGGGGGRERRPSTSLDAGQIILQAYSQTLATTSGLIRKMCILWVYDTYYTAGPLSNLFDNQEDRLT